MHDLLPGHDDRGPGGHDRVGEGVAAEDALVVSLVVPDKEPRSLDEEPADAAGAGAEGAGTAS